MTQHLVLTVIGDDRPGLVEALSDVVVAHEGSWSESRMAHLADKFAGIVTVEVPREQEQSLIQALEALSSVGLKVSAEKASHVAKLGESAMLSVMGNDRTGIIREVSKTLSGLGANVRDLNSYCEPAPMSSEMLFKAELEISLPDDVSIETLEAAVEEISSDLVVEIQK
ncbi:glycine cleavage system protein R [Marinomonas piezotolerans]|uniref:Glycine cleavage system transcriptional repressor n=1 Tax=Marinomonas piezotolerans TaxID=2213058 RepID=A0A370UC40_9GAMM|nr:ACT domain-containing protein [Marinomonas piezotolerans]RDL45360.1 glycine cleavage system protein R [Marinomonas piezotolerans]